MPLDSYQQLKIGNSMYRKGNIYQYLQYTKVASFTHRQAEWLLTKTVLHAFCKH